MGSARCSPSAPGRVPTRPRSPDAAGRVLADPERYRAGAARAAAVEALTWEAQAELLTGLYRMITDSTHRALG